MSMAHHIRAMVGAVLCTTACERSWSPSAPANGNQPNTPNASVSCTPTASASGGPITDPNGPFGHQTVIANTTDGLTLTNAHQIIDHASVPDGVRRADGTVLVYYVNGAAGSVYVARIVADTAQVIGPIAVDGVPRPAAVVDPDVQTVAGGKVRLFYLNGFGQPGSTAPRAMCSADSDDGVNFTTRGPAFTWTTGETYTDPSVVPLADGSWLMAISLGQQTVIARSSDGLVFTREAALTFGGVPELAIAPGGAVRLYVCAAGIVAYRSTDGGRAWTREQTVVGPGFNGHPIVCDPSLVAGTGIFVFKTG
jgi:hypothetical protein